MPSYSLAPYPSGEPANWHRLGQAVIVFYDAQPVPQRYKKLYPY